MRVSSPFKNKQNPLDTISAGTPAVPGSSLLHLFFHSINSLYIIPTPLPVYQIPCNHETTNAGEKTLRNKRALAFLNSMERKCGHNVEE